MREALRTFTAAGWAFVACLALALVLLAKCVADGSQKAADRLQQAEAHKTLADGRTAAAKDASAVRDRADARDQQIVQSTQETTDASAMRLMLLLATTALGACASSTRIVTPAVGCSMLVPAGWADPVPSAAFPQDAASVRDWQVFGVEQSGQLAKANGADGGRDRDRAGV